MCIVSIGQKTSLNMEKSSKMVACAYPAKLLFRKLYGTIADEPHGHQHSSSFWNSASGAEFPKFYFPLPSASV